MRKLLLSLAAVFGLTTVSAQEVLGYSFETANGTYTEITDGTVVTTGIAVGEEITGYVFTPSGSTEDSGTVEGYSLDFTFNYDGQACDQFVISGAGYVQVGKGSIDIDPSAGGYVFVNDVANVLGCVSPYDITMLEDTEISYKVIEDGAEKQLVVQYKNIGWNKSFWDEEPTAVDIQIRLYESSKVQIVFNNWGNLGEETTNVRIALRGQQEGLYALSGSVIEPEVIIGETSAGFTSASAEIEDGYTMTFTAPSACEVPEVSATVDLAVTSTTTTLSGEFESIKADKYLVLLSTEKQLSVYPENGKAYSVGDKIGNAVVLSAGTETEFETEEITPSTTYYVTVFAYNSFCKDGPKYNIDQPYAEGTTVTKPGAPAALTITDASANTLTFSVKANENNDNVIVVYTSELERSIYGDEPLVGELKGEYKDGDEIEGGGKVAYVGPSIDAFELNELEASTGYYLVAYSYDADFNYSSERLTDSESTYIVPPYESDFAAAKQYGLPVGWNAEEGKGIVRIEKKNTTTGGESEQQLVFYFSTITPEGVVASVTTSPVQVDKARNVASFKYGGFGTASRFAVPDPWTLADDDKIKLQVSTDGETFTDLTVYDADNQAKIDDVTTFVTIEGDLTPYVGQKVWLRFLVESYTPIAFGARLIIDKLSIYEYEAPEIPTVTVSAITYNSAKVSWESSYEAHQVSYGKVGEEPTVVDMTEGNELTLTDLTHETAYEVKVRGVIDEDSYSDWSEVVAFTTEDYPECEAPTDLSADLTQFDSDGKVALSWKAADDHLTWELRYRNASVTSWENVAGIEETQYVLTSLEAGTVYLWQVRANCTMDRQTVWSAQLQIETPIATSISAAKRGDLSISAQHGYVNLTNNGVHVSDVQIFDASGRLVNQVEVGGDYNAIIPVNVKGLLIIKVNLNGKSLTYKVVVD